MKREEEKSYHPKENILDIDTKVTQRRLNSFSRFTQAFINYNCRNIATVATTARTTGHSTTKLAASMVLSEKFMHQLPS